MDPAAALLITGGALQIIGVASIVWEIRHARRQFGLNSTSKVRRWAGRSLRRVGALVGIKKSATVHAGGAMAAVSVMATGEGRVIRSLTGKPTEEQIEILAERIEEIWEVMPKRLSDEAARRAGADEEEARARIEATKQVLDAVQDSALGGFRVRGYGAAAIIVGLALSTWGSVL